MILIIELDNQLINNKQTLFCRIVFKTNQIINRNKYTVKVIFKILKIINLNKVMLFNKIINKIL